MRVTEKLTSCFKAFYYIRNTLSINFFLDGSLLKSILSTQRQHS